MIYAPICETGDFEGEKPLSYLSKDSVLATLTSFLSYFVMSAIISPLGIVSGSLASQFDIAQTSATALFSYLTSGVLIGSFLSIVANPAIGSRMVILLSSAILALTLVLMRFVQSAALLPVAFIFIGAACGLLLATAAIVLTGVYRENHRPSALLATDSFYSFAGFATTPFAGWIIANAMHWSAAYIIALLITAIIFVLALFTRYPPEMKPPADLKHHSAAWTPAVFLVGAALFVYLVSFVFVYSWTPAHASAAFSVSPEASGLLISRFFLGLFFGQLVMFFLALRIDVRLIIGLVSVAAAFVTIGLWASSSASQLGVSLFTLGLIAGGLLKPLIAFGTQIVSHPTSRLIGFYMFCTALGSSVSPALGALIVERSDIKTLLFLTTGGFVLTFVLVAASIVVAKR